MEQKNKYNAGKIYKLTNTKTQDIYVGSTIRSLSDRFDSHKAAAAVYANNKKNKALNAVGWVCVNIELIEAFPCDDKDALRTREHHWIGQLKPSLNSNRALSSYADMRADIKEQYRNNANDYKDKAKARSKAYYVEKRVDILAKMRADQTTVCGCGGGTKSVHLKRHNNTQRHRAWQAHQALIAQQPAIN